MIALEFNSNVVVPAIINAAAMSSLYLVLALCMVLAYRMSRSVAFVVGGFATVGAYLYWWAASAIASGFQVMNWPRFPVLIGVTVVGGALGYLYGTVVTGRMATWPRVTVTTFSLGVMLLCVGVMGSIWRGVFFRPPSPFGQGRQIIFGYGVSTHQEVTVALVVTVVLAMTWILERTRFGVYVRAIADDAGAAEAVGIPVRRVATVIWCITGALGAMGGALVVVMTQITEVVVLFVLLRSLAAGVLGGFDSLPLALVGALLFGLVESVVGGAVFGPVDSGMRELLLMLILFSGILIVNRVRQGRSLALREV